MKKRTTLYRGLLLYAVPLFIMMAMIIVGCEPKESSGGTNEEEEVEEVTGYINISPNVPCDPEQEDLITFAKFAWEQFLALGWQSSWGQGGDNSARRGTADGNWDPKTSDYADNYQVVWETYAHVSELRPNGDPATNNMQPFDNPPHYSYLDMPAQGDPGASFLLFNNLDEDNEIGSCNIYPPGKVREELVLYQAKTNRSEYEYRMNTYGSEDELTAAVNKTQSNVQTLKKYYPNQGDQTSCDCPDDQGVLCLPCGGKEVGGVCEEGAIEIKTAWRLKTPEDDPSEYFTRNNLYYKNVEVGGQTEIQYFNAEFVLIGMHIIRKTHKYPEFIFTTFQHKSVEDQDYSLQLLYTDNNNNVFTVGDPESYERYAPIPPDYATVDAEVHAQLDQYPGLSIWKNYVLAGFQGPARDYAERSTGLGDSAFYFMANYVIESDIEKATSPTETAKPGLANFHGQGFGNNPYGNGDNVLISAQGLTVDMGGCQGCHGVGQTFIGSDFSFLLDHGFGKPLKEPATINGIEEEAKQNIKEYLAKMDN